MEITIPAWLVHGFEAAFGFLLVSSGLTTLMGWSALDPFELVLPYWLLFVFNICYTLSGVAIILGLFFHRGDVEGSGLVMLVPLLIARGILFGFLLGWGADAIVSLVFSFVFSAACLGRIYLIVKV